MDEGVDGLDDVMARFNVNEIVRLDERVVVFFKFSFEIVSRETSLLMKPAIVLSISIMAIGKGVQNGAHM